MTTRDEKAREWILGRFRLKTAQTKGGLSPTMVRGASSACPVEPHELDAALSALRDEGVLAFSGGLWWKRR